MKQHLSGRKGEIKVCPKVPSDVRYQMEESLKGIVEKEKEYRERFTIENPYGGPISESHDTHEYEEIEEIHRQAWERGKTTPSSLGKGKTPAGQSKKGKFGDYFVPRTTPGAQLTIKSALSDAQALFCLFQEVIEWVGPSNVVHMVTDNGSNYVAAGRLIQDHFTHINWSPCAAHCLNLVLKDIAKMDHVAAIVNQASKLTRWVLKTENFDPIDYESIDKLDVWIVDDEEEPFLNHEDIELLYVANNNSSSPLNLIPGPRKLPLIGNLHLLVGNSLPHHHAFKDLADKYGPLMHLQLGEIPFLVVSSVEVAKEILKTHDINFANRPQVLVGKTMFYNCNNIGFSPYGEYWRYVRKICTLELLSTRRVESFRHIREEENTKLAKWIASNEGLPINLSNRILLTSYDIITRVSLGKKTMEEGTFTSIIIETVKLLMGLSIADLYPSITLLPLISGLKLKMERMRHKTDRILDHIIEEHRMNAAETDHDLTDVLIKCQQDGTTKFTTDNIKAVLMVTSMKLTPSNFCIKKLTEIFIFMD
ncbi:hypothetical protein BUALT_Bualt05G0062600 [Buddleja alternifolia]|uniref:DUF659 domain-containing protein n=1 Tax=Buddleja alternifolia TaxID=168488 RepID=A0AAV6XGZ2_9LAMI|nr:hypothetical protein BUALT_Bualt05G0062600 [Buddleja alternifolia]